MHEAVAHHQTAFYKKYLSFFRYQKKFMKGLFKVAATYGNLKVFEQASDPHICFFFPGYGSCLHFAIKHGHHDVLKWFLNGHAEQAYANKGKERVRNAIKYEHNGSNLLGTAVMYGDLESVRILIDSKCYKNLHLFSADSIVWQGDTAIQACLFLCCENYDLVKYLFQRHQPNYFNQVLLDSLRDEDPYIERIEKLEINQDGSDIVLVSSRASLKGLITHKPDGEGLTLDERLDRCRAEKMFSVEQYEELKQILDKKRKDN